jgi:hypothetical protein
VNAADLRLKLMERLAYEPKSGHFRWRIAPSNQHPAGSLAGSMNSKGYAVIRTLGALHLAHRLAWLFVHGAWPSGHIDHINGVRSDNRLENLRDVSRSVNLQNQRHARSDNKAGLLGVKRARKGFEARISADGQYLHLGTFDTPAAAHAAYLAAKRQLHKGCTL